MIAIMAAEEAKCRYGVNLLFFLLVLWVLPFRNRGRGFEFSFLARFMASIAFHFLSFVFSAFFCPAIYFARVLSLSFRPLETAFSKSRESDRGEKCSISWSLLGFKPLSITIDWKIRKEEEEEEKKRLRFLLLSPSSHQKLPLYRELLPGPIKRGDF